jgi:PAS domain S-box-containing protein
MLENTTKQKEAQAAITERISAQEETRRNQKHLRLVIDSLPSLISYIDNNQYYRFANRAYQHWIGDGVHVEGRPVKDVLHDGGYEAVRPYIESALRGEKVEYEQAVKFRDGSERFVHSLYIPDIDDQGAVRGFVVFVTDLTDRRHAEERLRRTEKLAATGRLAATIAHEINNPLEAVTNLLYLAKGDPEISDSGRQFLSRAEGELSRVAHITRQTLGFYRDSVGPVRLSLQDVLEDVLQLYGKKLIQHRIEVVRKFKGDAGITGLSGEVRQVFSNLIANSLDAMPGGGRLTVRVKPVSPRGRGHRDGVRVTIADTGVGIAHEQTRQIFEPFFTTKNDRGTGLGLWLTRNIIQKHGGWIRVRSGTVAGRSGTVFSVFFPRKFQHHEERKVA